MITRKNVKRFYSNLEVRLVEHIKKTGETQIKRRRKAGLSVYYLKNGRIVEQKSDKTEIQGLAIQSKWISISSHNRRVELK